MQQKSKISDLPVYFQNLAVKPSEAAHNLGIMFDSSLHMKSHISSICRASFFQVRQLRQIRSSLDKTSAIILANFMVYTKLAYCNALLYGLPAVSTIRLQYVQNALARVVCKAPNLQSHNSALLKELHWLPVPERIKFKIAVMTFKTLNSGKPSYLADILSIYTPSRNLRSSGTYLLTIPDLRTTFGRRSFSFAALTVGTLYHTLYALVLLLLFFEVI